MAETALKSGFYAGDHGALIRQLPKTGLPLRPATPPRRAAKHHRTIFISDIHLGTRFCKADVLVDFLKNNSCDTLFLVGDIVDGWQLRRRWYWTDSHSDVVAEILHKADTGTRVVLVPGNHDEFLRDYCGRALSGIGIANETIHETADGKRLLVLHGDQFDGVVACAKWLVHLGDHAYTAALILNNWLAVFRRALGFPYWSLSAFLKRKAKSAVAYVAKFEEAVARQAAARGVDGVVCGHIHQAEIRMIGDVLYLNDGDWVESCSALVEDARGNLEILRWTTASPAKQAAAQSQAALIPA